MLKINNIRRLISFVECYIRIDAFLVYLGWEGKFAMPARHSTSAYIAFSCHTLKRDSSFIANQQYIATKRIVDMHRSGLQSSRPINLKLAHIYIPRLIFLQLLCIKETYFILYIIFPALLHKTHDAILIVYQIMGAQKYFIASTRMGIFFNIPACPAVKCM